MRENTRCEVEEPMSTPTLKTTISSSSTSERPVEEKKTRPPCASSVMRRVQRCRVGKGDGYAFPSGKASRAPCPRALAWSASFHHAWARRTHGLAMGEAVPAPLPTLQEVCAFVLRTHELRHYRAFLVEVGFHPVHRAFGLELFGELLAQIRILHVVGNRGAAFRNIHGGVVGVLLAGRAGLAAGIVRTEPCGQPEAFLGGVEMLVIPARAARCRRNHAEL